LGQGLLKWTLSLGSALFQGKSIDQPKIAEEIRAWLRQDLATNKIPLLVLNGAYLAVNITSFVVPWNEPTREIFYSAWKSRTHGTNESMRYGV